MSPASAYFTTNDNNTNLATEVAELQKQLENLTRQNQTHQRTRQGSRPQTTTNRGAPTDQWRTWTFWCHTHGANLTHNSTACSRPKDGHKKEATQRNPMGGNCKRDYLTGQWCHPVYHTPHATPTTTAWRDGGNLEQNIIIDIAPTLQLHAYSTLASPRLTIRTSNLHSPEQKLLLRSILWPHQQMVPYRLQRWWHWRFHRYGSKTPPQTKSTVLTSSKGGTLRPHRGVTTIYSDYL
jgi:hypothetical protein